MSDLRTRVWYSLTNIKFKAIYIHEYSAWVDWGGRCFSFFLSLASASSVAAWVVWKEHPAVWAGIVMIAQVLHVAKPYLPFIGKEKDLLGWSFDFENLYLQYERLWFDFESKKLTKDKAENRFYEFREREVEIEKEIGHNCPKFQRLVDKAQEQTDHALSLSFGKEQEK